MVISSWYAVGCLKTAGLFLVSSVAMCPSFRFCRCLPHPPSFAYPVRFSYVSAFASAFRPGQSVSPRPRAWDVRASCLFAVCGRSVRFACVACVPCRSLTAFVRYCLVIALDAVVLPVGFPVACLAGVDVIPSGVLAPHRFSCLPVISYPSDVIRLMWLVVMSGGVFSCCLCPLLACRCHPLGAGYNHDTPSAPSGRVGERGRLFGSSRCDGGGWRKKIGGGFSFPSPCLLGCFFLASADYSSVSSDFVVALGGFFEACFAFVVRVELDGDGGLVLVGGGLLACLTVLEKH